MEEVHIIKNSKEYTIYENIPSLCKSRNLKLENYTKLSIKDFNNIKRSTGLIKFDATRNNSKIIIYFIMPESKYGSKGEITKLVENNTADKYIIIFAVARKITLDNPALDVEFLDGTYYLLRDYPALLETQGIKIRVIPDEELKQFMHLYKIPSVNCFSKISSKDQAIIYSEIKKGDVIAVTSVSLASSLQAGQIRLVI